MLREVKHFDDILIQLFGSVSNRKQGEYAIPWKTGKGDAFMKLVIDENLNLRDDGLFWDEKFTKRFH